MGKKLIIAEKPSLAKKIAAALGVTGKNKNGAFESDDIIVATLVGHVIEAEYPKTAWTLDNLPLAGLNSPKYKASKGKEKIVSNVKKEISRSDVDEVVNAGDADTEGSLLVYELYEHFDVLSSGKKFTRMWILAEDTKTIKKAYEDRYSQDEDMKFVNAGKGRGLADVKLGFNFSRLYTIKHGVRGESYAIGRVMTPTMKIVRDRELEIQNFNPEDYWTIKGNFKKGDKEFTGDYFRINEEGKSTTSLPKDVFQDIDSKLQDGTTYLVDSKKVAQKSKKPDLLPNLNDILKSMSKLHRMNSKKTTSIMQTLYEAQFCTYPRSEAKFLPTSMEDDVSAVFSNYENIYSAKMSGAPVKFDINNKKVFDDKKVGSHFAIIPMTKSVSDLNGLDADHRKVMDYIISKFMMAFMGDYKYESTNIVLKSEDLSFKITGKIEKDKGYKSYDCASNKADSKDVVVPDIAEGDEVELLSYKSEKKQTKPPAPITELTLLEIMENVHKLYKKQKEREHEEEDEDDEHEVELEFDGAFSLGTPATRGGIIEKLVNVKYLKKNKQVFVVTDIGIDLLNTAEGCIDIETTATFEEDMANILSDKLNVDDFNKKIDTFVSDVIKKEVPAIRDAMKARAAAAKTDIPCPLCSAAVNRYENAYRCSESGSFDSKKKSFSGCQFSVIKNMKNLGHVLTEDELKRLISGEELDIAGRKLVFDKDSRYFIKIKMPEIGIECPLCTAPVVDTGKGYRCSKAGTFDGAKKKFTGCQFSMMKHIKPLKYDISEEVLGKLIGGEKIDVDGSKIVFDKENSFFVKIEFASSGSEKLEGVECPSCGGSVSDAFKTFKCENSGTYNPKTKKNEGATCNVVIWKNQKFLGRNINEDDLKNLFSGDIIEHKGKKVKFDKDNKYLITKA